jgi:hypothetical protein
VHSTNTDHGNWRSTVPAAADLPIASQPTTPRGALTDTLVTPSAHILAAAQPHQLNTAALHVFGAHGPSLAQSSLACDNTALCVHTIQTLSVTQSRSRPAATPGMPSIHPSTVAASHLISHCAVSRSAAAPGAMSSHGPLYRPSRVQLSVADLSTSQLPCYHMAAALSQPCPSAPDAAQLGQALDTSSHAMSASQRTAIEASVSEMIARSAKRWMLGCTMRPLLSRRGASDGVAASSGAAPAVCRHKLRPLDALLCSITQEVEHSGIMMSGVRLQACMLVSSEGGIQFDVINAAQPSAESVQCKYVVVSACTFCRTQRSVGAPKCFVDEDNPCALTTYQLNHSFIWMSVLAQRIVCC